MLKEYFATISFPIYSLRQSFLPSSNYSIQPDSFQQIHIFTNYTLVNCGLGVDGIQS